MSVKENFELVRRRIAMACRRSGRDPSSVTLVGVTKTVPVELIREAAALGLADVGENRVQAARQKQQELSRFRGPLTVDRVPEEPVHGTRFTGHGVRWHLIGHLQRNKAKPAVEVFDVIHSVDSRALIDELERQATKKKRDRGHETGDQIGASPSEIFLQVNISGEQTKSGCRPSETIELARLLAQQPHLKLCGLMTIAPAAQDPEEVRPIFRALRALRDDVQRSLQSLSPVSCLPSLLLSMGMSQDFEVAIEEGADVVRIGTAIFGTRDRGQGTRSEQPA